MKRMVKNGDLLDVSEDGSGVSFGGNLKVGGTIIANGEIRGGDVSASKFYLGTEEMPLVKANPAGDAAGTLEKIKIGNVSYKVGGGGGGGSDYTAGKNITISEAKEISLPDNIDSLKSISIYKNNEPEKIILKQTYGYDLTIETKNYQYFPSIDLFAGSGFSTKEVKIRFDNIALGKLYQISFDFNGINSVSEGYVYPFISRTRIPDVPSEDGTYILKATVSNGTLTYSWIAG